MVKAAFVAALIWGDLGGSVSRELCGSGETTLGPGGYLRCLQLKLSLTTARAHWSSLYSELCLNSLLQVTKHISRRLIVLPVAQGPSTTA